MIKFKAGVLSIVSSAVIMMIGIVLTAPISAHETKIQIEVESVPNGEPAGTMETAKLTQILQGQRKPLQNNKVLRGVHPKSHGCVAATFTVLEDIDIDYQIGLFAQPGKYDALIRYSNASVLLDPDLKDGENGSRGMAIKVVGLKKNLGKIRLKDGGARNQDFLMVNTPEFAFADVRQYLRLERILELGGGGCTLLHSSRIEKGGVIGGESRRVIIIKFAGGIRARKTEKCMGFL